MSNNPFDHPSVLSMRASSAQNRWRRVKDRLARATIGGGGLLVLIAILLIFVFLVMAVAPLFGSAKAELISQFQLKDTARTVPLERHNSSNDTIELSGKVLWQGVEEFGDLAYFGLADGTITYHSTATGVQQSLLRLPLLEGETLKAVINLEREKQLYGMVTHNGRFFVVRQTFAVHHDHQQRTIRPQVSLPYGHAGIMLPPHTYINSKIMADDEQLTLTTIGDEHLHVMQYHIEHEWQSEDTRLRLHNRQTFSLSSLGLKGESFFVEVTPSADWIYIIADGGNLVGLKASREGFSVKLNQSLLSPSTEPSTRVTSVSLLLGGVSLIVGDNQGNITQWFGLKQDDRPYQLVNVRRFSLSLNAITQLVSEQRRKGFIAVDNKGRIAHFFSTSDRRLWQNDLASDVDNLSLNPRSNVMMLNFENSLAFFRLDNPHPEISWSALWEKVWYENYPEPDFVYQSSAADLDFEAKFSFVPLGFGTLKAAFYALLVAIPIAIFGAIFSAYFMAPKMRSVVKPTVEVMEALPTVVIGFLAGLWLAPIIENYLVGVLIMVIIVPICICLFGLFWSTVPTTVRAMIPAGWQAALLLPVVILSAWFCLHISLPLEQWLFDGNARLWLEQHGIDYQQRNALVVGVAMGFAVIPTIFSIAEDALSSVPKHLSDGSLALGASAWQTLIKVIFPTASPGIFSAVMIGFGRAIGETMIVLMATGNTPIMDASIFEGLRSFAANIAIEMPESQVDSTHYRLLFLAALILFLFTFVVNSIAEHVRFRLRKKYREL